MSNRRCTRRLVIQSECCPCRGATLDKLLQPAILAVLAHGPLHGYVILQQLAGVPGFGGEQPDPTGIYRHLRSMERRGLLNSSWDLSPTGPAKRKYRLTASGRKCIASWVCTLRAYRASIRKLERFASASIAAGSAKKHESTP